jgi:hypothetical protein
MQSNSGSCNARSNSFSTSPATVEFFSSNSGKLANCLRTVPKGSIRFNHKRREFHIPTPCTHFITVLGILLLFSVLGSSERALGLEYMGVACWWCHPHVQGQGVIGKEDGEVKSLPINELVACTARVRVGTNGGEDAADCVSDHVVSHIMEGLVHLPTVEGMLRVAWGSHVSSTGTGVWESLDWSETMAESPEDFKVRVWERKAGVQGECCESDWCPSARAAEQSCTVSWRWVHHKVVGVGVLDLFGKSALKLILKAWTSLKETKRSLESIAESTVVRWGQ